MPFIKNTFWILMLPQQRLKQAVCFIRLVQMKTVQLLFLEMQFRPLNIVLLGVEIVIILTHQLMDSLYK